MSAAGHAVQGRRAADAAIAGRRFVFNTATLVSAALRPSSPAAQAFSLALSTGVICTSESALDQIAAILNRRTLDCYIRRRARTAFVDLLRRHAWLCPAPPAKSLRKPSRAQQLKALLAFAASAEADALVTIAPLPRTRTHRTLRILTPEELLSRFSIA
jgi:predicted nucleic acid-binding protein